MKRITWWLAAAAALLSACGTQPRMGGPGGTPHVAAGGDSLGAQAGGAQDINFARQQIAAGQVPPAASFLTEGLLAEHDLPVSGAACTSPLCVRPAIVEASHLATGERELWLHLGMTSSVSVAEFKRPPIDLVVAIDKSSSMSVDMRETNAAVTSLIDTLGPDDRMAVLTFDDTIQELHPLARVNEPAALAARVREVQAGGGWAIQEAVTHAYGVARAADRKDGRMQRVIVLSCGYPSVSADHQDPFSQLVLSSADQGIGMTFVGVLLGFSPDLAKLLGDAHGGSFTYADSLEAIDKVFHRDFDLMVTPIVHDLSIKLALGAGHSLAEVHGLPGTGDPSALTIEVPTVFFSRNRGAIVARLERADGTAAAAPIGTIAVAFRTPDGADHQEVIDLRAADDQPGARKAVALVNAAEQLRAIATAFHGGDRAGAGKLADALLGYLEEQATALADDGLRREVELVRSLRALVVDLVTAR